MENVKLLKLGEGKTCPGWAATFAVDGRIVEVQLTTEDGEVYKGETTEIGNPKLGVLVTLVEYVATGCYYNRILTIRDYSSEDGAAWQILDGTRSSYQAIREIAIV